MPWGLVVADEAQHVKNARVLDRPRPARDPERGARVALTGTPVENNLTELWAILDWATPGLLGSRHAFRKRVGRADRVRRADQGARRSPTWSGRSCCAAASPTRGSRPSCRRRPRPTTRSASPASRSVLYEAYVRDTMERIERADEAQARRGLVLTLLTGLKQICNHPGAVPQAAERPAVGRSEKLDLLDELLGTILAEDGAALVFTQYVAMARLLGRHLAGRASTPLPARRHAGPRAGGDGRPLPGGRGPGLPAVAEGGRHRPQPHPRRPRHPRRPLVEPGVEEQATDRAYRIGQTRPVQVHRLVTEGTIEERIAELLARKRALADAVLGPRRGRADRAERRRAARPGDPAPRRTRRQSGTEGPSSPTGPRTPAAARRRGGAGLGAGVEEAAYA